MNRREMEILAECLEAMEAGASVDDCLRRYPGHRSPDELLQTVQFVRRNAVHTPSPGFRKNGRQELLQSLPPRAAAEKAQPVRRAPAVGGLMRRAAAALMVAIMLVVSFGTAGTVYASGQALPGDVLYPVKLMIEDARLLTVSGEKEVFLNLLFLEKRTEEARDLIEAGQSGDLYLLEESYLATLERATSSMEQSARDHPAESRALIHQGEQAVQARSAELAGLLELVPPEAKPAIERALSATNNSRDTIRALLVDHKPGENPSQPDPDFPEAEPSGPPEGAPGKPDDVGPPEGSPGKPDDTGPPEWAPGKPDDTGPPEWAPGRPDDTGPPEWAPGKPDDVGPPEGAPGRPDGYGPPGRPDSPGRKP
jgi:hypothetical protein